MNIFNENNLLDPSSLDSGESVTSCLLEFAMKHSRADNQRPCWVIPALICLQSTTTR